MTPRIPILAASMSVDDIRARMRVADANARGTRRWNVTETGDSSAQLHIYGVIGGFWGDVAAADVVPALRALDVDELHVYINSPGGDVYEGIAIRNALRNHRAHVTVTVDGLAASAASYIAVAGDEVVMASNAEVMIHDAWTIALGNAEEMRVVADDLDRISDNIAGMYADKAGGTAAEWRAVMKAETWYSAEEAVAAGLADRLDTDAPAAAARFDLSMFAHAGRTAAPAPLIPAAMAPAALAPTHRKDNTVNPEQLAAALAAGQIDQATHDAALAAYRALNPVAAPAAAAPVAPMAGAPGVAVPAEYAAGPAAAVVPAATTIDRPASFASVASDIMAAAQSRDLRAIVHTVNNALETVGEGNDGGEAFIGRPAWLGEIWQAETDGRPWIDSLGPVKPLTARKMEGFRWVREDETDKWDEDETPAHVEIYEGNFAEVPTGTWKTEKVEADSEDWGFGTKVDNIFMDLGSPDLIGSLFGKLGAVYDKDSDAHVRTELLSAATGPAPAVVGVLPALTAIAFDLKRIGASLDKVWVSENLFTNFAALKFADLPAWLAGQLGFADIRNGDAKVADNLSFEVDFNLAPGTMVGYDKRAFTVFESPRIQLRALDISHRATDIGFFAYGGSLENDVRAIRKRTVNLA
uniref:head maturation protease, ClpP-related n=1 Tax=Microbacterium proteolyticum TaxID=1572644 RepID=UPI002415A041|nr:head maturation protease, ClpP-related [Microbacterium proteolyticum]